MTAEGQQQSRGGGTQPRLPLVQVVQAVARPAKVTRAEIVGLAPRAALEGFPKDIPLPDFDPERQLIETALYL